MVVLLLDIEISWYLDAKSATARTSPQRGTSIPATNPVGGLHHLWLCWYWVSQRLVPYAFPLVLALFATTQLCIGQKA